LDGGHDRESFWGWLDERKECRAAWCEGGELEDERLYPGHRIRKGY